MPRICMLRRRMTHPALACLWIWTKTSRKTQMKNSSPRPLALSSTTTKIQLRILSDQDDDRPQNAQRSALRRAHANILASISSSHASVHMYLQARDTLPCQAYAHCPSRPPRTLNRLRQRKNRNRKISFHPRYSEFLVYMYVYHVLGLGLVCISQVVLIPLRD